MADDGVYEEEVYEEDAQRVCKVYDEDDFFTVLVQLLLAFLALFSLWFKRNSEHPKRTFRTWFLDVSKQGVGACYAHVLNMVCFISRGIVRWFFLTIVARRAAKTKKCPEYLSLTLDHSSLVVHYACDSSLLHHLLSAEFVGIFNLTINAHGMPCAT
jgi:hypothetical protein